MEGFEWAFTDAMEDMATVATAAATAPMVRMATTATVTTATRTILPSNYNTFSWSLQ